jgi:hypothetical protein
MRIHRALLATLLAALLACHSTRQIAVPQSNGQLQGNPQVVNVSRQDRSVLTVYQPEVKGDSLIGWLDKPSATAPSTQRVALSLTEIRDISATKVDAARTTGAALGGGLVLVGILGLIAIAAFLGSIGS